MQILLIRHGQSEADLLDVHEGRADFPLTAEGIEQVKKMTAWVNAEYPPEMIWSSTLQRAAQTAAMLAETVGCPVEYLDDLQEHNNGELAGKPMQDHPFPFDILPHEKLGGNGESIIEFRGRLEQIFYTIKKRSEPYQRIAIVTHGGSIARIIETLKFARQRKDVKNPQGNPVSYGVDNLKGLQSAYEQASSANNNNGNDIQDETDETE